MNTAEVLGALADILEARKTADPADSYVASLYAKGIDAIAAKITEEAGEAVAAGRGEGDAELIHEVADLWFHCMVLLAERGLRPEAVLETLAERLGVSGHAEKAARGHTRHTS